MNRKYTACLYAGVLFTAVICVTVISHLLEKSRLLEAENNMETAPAVTTAGTGNTTDNKISVAGQEILLWTKNDQYYAFLPSACKEAGLEPEISENIDPDSVTWLYSEHIPAVFIETESGTSDLINTDKNVKEPGTITVLEPDGSISLEHSLEYMKGRGNTSYTEFEKKPFRSNLQNPLLFLGWNLVKNGYSSPIPPILP